MNRRLEGAMALLAARPARKADSARAGEPFPMIEARRIVKVFRNAAGEFHALKGVDLTVRRGEFVAIIGKSGSGKSTLLNMITGIDHPTSGQMRVNGMDIYGSMNESQRSRWRGRNLGVVFQFFQLIPTLSLLENVMLPMDLAGVYPFEERPRRARELLAQVGLENEADKRPGLVSTGQQQAAAIARALACDPPLIVADEPTGNLDSRSAQRIIELFEELAAAGKTLVIVTHDPSMMAHARRTIVISDGELVDEAVSRALPRLSHRRMLEVSKQARRAEFNPGQVVVEVGQPVTALGIVRRGWVEAVALTEQGERVVATLGAGEMAGVSQVRRGRPAPLRLRAGQEPVEMLWLEADRAVAVLEEAGVNESG